MNSPADKPLDIPASDVAILDLLRRRDSLTVSELAGFMSVTATAVRQRLNRLMGMGLIERRAIKAARGRPSHHYALTENGRRKTGSNFADLAVALWEEVRAIKDPEVRKGLLQRIAQRMAEQMAASGPGRGVSLADRMKSVANLFRERGIPFEVETHGALPVLTALACPYPGLAETDRTVCSMERLAFSEMLGVPVRLTRCRLDGESCCTFETPAPAAAIATEMTPAAQT